MPVSNKDVCSYFYEALGQGSYRCKQCGNERKQLTSTGYSNLISHLDHKHAGFQDEYAATFFKSDQRLQDFGFVSEETSHRFQWMHWVVERNMALWEVDNELTRSMSWWKSVSSRVLLNNMHSVAKKVGVNLEVIMGICFGIMFDGWSNGSMHHVAVYGVFETDSVLRLQLLAVSPLDDGSQDADAHIKLFDGVLDVYNKTLEMVAFIVGNNCNTNQAIVTKIGVPLVGCASHRFNLAVNKFLIEYEPLLADLNTLMSQLSQVNNFAELAKSTSLHPVKRNMTRWSSNFEMLQRYVRIRPQIKTVDAVEELVATGASHRKLLVLLEHMKKFQSVTKKLQCDGIDLADVRLLFDSVVAEYPCMREQLKPTAKIVHSPVFESAVVKVIKSGSLSSAQKAVVERFKAPECGSKRTVRQEDYATQILRAGPSERSKQVDGATYSSLLKQLPQTSNVCE